MSAALPSREPGLALINSPEEAWGALVDEFGETMARRVVKAMDGGRAPSRAWLARRDARARLAAGLPNRPISIRARARLLGIDQRTLRRWLAEQPKEEAPQLSAARVVSMPQQMAQTGSRTLRSRPNTPRRSAA